MTFQMRAIDSGFEELEGSLENQVEKWLGDLASKWLESCKTASEVRESQRMLRKQQNWQMIFC